jgi:hypothetical protein
MSHKAVVVIDIDSLDAMEQSPAEFVRRLKNSMLMHRQLGGSVSCNGDTVANVVWSGHTDLSPILKFVGFHVENLSYTVPEKMKPSMEELDVTLRKLAQEGCRIEAVREYRKYTGADLKQALSHVSTL